jgi:non-specific serine/threonine protein kinase
MPAQTKTLETPKEELTRGTNFANRYEIIEELGRGGMGRVYRVDDTKVKEEVALKLIKPEVAADKKTIDRFRNEIKSARKIRHKNVCQMFDLGEYEGIHFITMEYVTGEDLKSLIRRVKIDTGTAIKITKQVCDGLSEAHRLGVVHRDLKPSNIMIDKAGNARIMDFGIARSMKGEALTGENVIVGTPDYMSPEQVEGKEIDQRSDIYSLGVVLFEMLTGERPFKGDTSLSVAMKHKSEAPPNPKWLNDQIPDRLSRLVLMCLEKDKERRYQTAEELLSSLITLDKKKLHIAEKEEKKKSVVVLPFDDMSPGKDNEYFSDGLTEEIISDLSKIQSLRVISRTSAMMLKGTKKPMRTIGHELDVRYVLEGSVRKAGNNLRITAQLIDATSDAHLWAEKYSGTMDDVFDIQEKVSRAIVDALELHLTPEEKKKISEHPIDNPQAYEYYIQVRQDLLYYTEGSLDRIVRRIKHALNIIGDNELLYAVLGTAYMNYLGFAYKTDESYLEKIEECINKIVRLNPDSPSIHFLRGNIHFIKRNMQAAAKEIKKGLAADPSNVEGLFVLSAIYFLSGKTSVARQMIKRMKEIDPLNPWNYGSMGWVELYEGKFDLAVQSFYAMYQIDPENPVFRYLYAISLSANRQVEEACSVIDLIARDTPLLFFAGLGTFLKHAWRGETNKALEAVSSDWTESARFDETFSWHVAAGYALIKKKDEALDWLENATNKGAINFPYFSEYCQWFKNIRGEPRFKKLMERVKHEWENFEV